MSLAQQRPSTTPYRTHTTHDNDEECRTRRDEPSGSLTSTPRTRPRNGHEPTTDHTPRRKEARRWRTRGESSREASRAVRLARHRAFVRGYPPTITASKRRERPHNGHDGHENSAKGRKAIRRRWARHDTSRKALEVVVVSPSTPHTPSPTTTSASHDAHGVAMGPTATPPTHRAGGALSSSFVRHRQPTPPSATTTAALNDAHGVTTAPTTTTHTYHAGGDPGAVRDEARRAERLSRRPTTTTASNDAHGVAKARPPRHPPTTPEDTQDERETRREEPKGSLVPPPLPPRTTRTASPRPRRSRHPSTTPEDTQDERETRRDEPKGFLVVVRAPSTTHGPLTHHHHRLERRARRRQGPDGHATHTPRRRTPRTSARRGETSRKALSPSFPHHQRPTPPHPPPPPPGTTRTVLSRSRRPRHLPTTPEETQKEC
ncbi:hypothetical protein BD410DRAFT_809566 [Rickenella mellea]|uniref:Uncharacterized protein n=1 Tax=Rickenella mellea TaxID=50990 RepID=A0A4Y7PGV5_9AGAM|nr:hypothetical protein BD410DRAFT_809566 [Rickenella mellea]